MIGPAPPKTINQTKIKEDFRLVDNTGDVELHIWSPVSGNSSGPISIFEAILWVQLPMLVDYVCEKC